jgi:hypothetical protein
MNNLPIVKNQLNDEEKTLIKMHLNDKNYNVVVEFRKADDSIRIINCTTAREIVARYLPEKTEQPMARKKNEDVQIVFDTDKKEWRSFRWDRVTAVSTRENFNF